ncbi:hypothetical protein BDY24DRAFT_394619 [Mrakia frigida]|uniref:uncharacterized protein n=1 Tax=Mrakia frigida TaxID=29902 RepID=UPI003FCC0D42
MTDPKILKSLEKHLQKEAKQDSKILDDAHKGLEAALKAEQKAFDAEEKAVSHQEKLAKVENKAAHKLVHAQHKHENAVTDQNKAQVDIQLAKDRNVGVAHSIETTIDWNKKYTLRSSSSIRLLLTTRNFRPNAPTNFQHSANPHPTLSRALLPAKEREDSTLS